MLDQQDESVRRLYVGDPSPTGQLSAADRQGGQPGERQAAVQKISETSVNLPLNIARRHGLSRHRATMLPGAILLIMR